MTQACLTSTLYHPFGQTAIFPAHPLKVNRKTAIMHIQHENAVKSKHHYFSTETVGSDLS